ncbi:MAG: hypothetical protein HUU55_21270 [Myxococcales bacterium]|nr:hypothetical protein [Myxococcales bacterium]
MSFLTPSSHETSTVTTATFADLDTDAVNAYIEARLRRLPTHIQPADIAVRLGLVVASGPRQTPTVCALYLFGVAPQWFLPQLTLGCVRIAGLTLTDPVVARADLEGPLPSLVTRATQFVSEYTLGSSQTMPKQDSNRSEYDPALLQEVLVNALVHRDLRSPGRTLLRLFDDRLEVWNPGGFPQPIDDVEHFAEEGGISLPRNPFVALGAQTLGLGEQLGRGLPKIHHAVRDLAATGPIFRVSKEDVCVTLPSGLSLLSGPGRVAFQN